MTMKCYNENIIRLGNKESCDNMTVKCISNKDLERTAERVKSDKKYGREGILIDSALKQFPLNHDKAIVSMKICLIDLTNGTNLMRNLGKDGGIYDLAEQITKVDFDKRVSNGDLSLVNELAKWTKEKLGKNLFSFISKYCLYHNVHCYNRDDFVIYDSVLATQMYQYISKEDYQMLTGHTLYKNSIKKYKNNFQYEEYKKVIDFILTKNEISVEKPHRKIDWLIWYENR